MNKLNAYLDEASKAYYAGHPFLDDSVFDKLAAAAGYNKVGAKQHEHIHRHVYRMYSLQKHYEGETKEPLKHYTKRTTRSSKLDGAAISLLYIHGELALGLTRGDGIEGTDITDKVKLLQGVPLKIRTQSHVLQVTGEVIAPKEIPNARNYAAGALNLNDLEEFKTRKIQFIAYGLQDGKTDNGGTYTMDMQFLESEGFRTILDENLHNEFPCDGLVVRIDDNHDFVTEGYTAKHPKGAYAVKERQEAVETVLLDVEWNTGRTGKVTPVAILEPVMIGDAKISRATLNNPGFIQALELRIGDRVGVIRSGDIIPMITYRVDE
jgi:DNA ligase (NAD+)